MNRKTLFSLIALVSVVAMLAVQCPGPGQPAENKLEIFSWWTGGGEADGLAQMFKIYSQKYPDTEIINATVAGGAGSNAKAVLKTRMLGGDPPDSFQVHAGQEIADWVKADMMEPLDDLYTSEGWDKVFPKDLLDILLVDGHYYSVPVNIHRANVLWYNKQVFTDNNLTAPKTFDDFFTVAGALEAKGITPLALGDNGPWAAVNLFETVLIGTLGQEGYNGLWNGRTSWDDPKVTQALENFKKMLIFVNEDHSALSWDQAAQYVIDGKAGMTIMGDWADGYFVSKGFTGYGWAPAPGNDGIFDMLSDSFGLPKGAKHRDNAINWLKVCGSFEGQEAFNPLKGSIPARTDGGKANYDEYLQSAMKDWASNKLCPSLAHGAAAPEGWVTAATDAIAVFVTKQDVSATQAALAQAAKDAMAQ
ncbi:MAG: ABC transporter substrate-binding protein [Chloroflexi bacterium]|nr:ABC transporter substrate-binding protein [Chloroflexota bacterium]MBU1752136.1 ABC transporter substrate-binding protein [Chloroflexota bacterium]